MDAVVIAGGSARRMGGIDKAMLPLAPGGQSLLAHAVAECAAAGLERVIVAGPRRQSIAGVAEWVDDLSPDGGPAVGIYSCLARSTGEYLFITAGDQPVDRVAVATVVAAAAGHEGAWAVRLAGASVLERGNAQPLFACVRRDVLAELLAPTGGRGQSPLRLLAGRDMVAVELPELADVDTWADAVRVARHRGEAMTDLWLAQVAAALGVDAAVPSDDLLEVTRDVAHTVERKAAPLTTFLAGVAVGSGAATPEQATAAIREALALWTDAQPES